MIAAQVLIGLIVVLTVLLSFVVPLPGWIVMALIGLLGVGFLIGGVVFVRRTA